MSIWGGLSEVGGHHVVVLMLLMERRGLIREDCVIKTGKELLGSVVFLG